MVVRLETWRFSPRASEADGERAERTSVREHARHRDREAIGEKHQVSALTTCDDSSLISYCREQ